MVFLKIPNVLLRTVFAETVIYVYYVAVIIYDRACEMGSQMHNAVEWILTNPNISVLKFSKFCSI